MNKLRKFAMTAVFALGGLAMVSCGTNNDIAQAAVDQLYISGYQQVYGQMQLPAKAVVESGEELYDVEISWSGTPSARWEFSEPADGFIIATPTLPNSKLGEQDEEFTLTATATYNKATATRTFSGYLMASSYDYITVSEAKALAEGEDVTIRGVAVNAHAGGAGFYVSDATGSIYVYSQQAHVGKFQYGQTVEVKGRRGVNSKSINGNSVLVPQITNPTSFSVVDMTIKNAPVDSAVEATVDEILSWSKDPSSSTFVNHSGELYKVTGKCVKYGSYEQWEVVNDAGKYISFYANTANDEGERYTAQLAEYENKTLDFYIVIHDINTSSSGNTTWRTVPIYWELAA